MRAHCWVTTKTASKRALHADIVGLGPWSSKEDYVTYAVQCCAPLALKYTARWYIITAGQLASCGQQMGAATSMI
eukprot:6695198-Karenia_brevis.AAC.1